MSVATSKASPRCRLLVAVVGSLFYQFCSVGGLRTQIAVRSGVAKDRGACLSWAQIDALCEEEWAQSSGPDSKQAKECKKAELSYKRAEADLALHEDKVSSSAKLQSDPEARLKVTEDLYQAEASQAALRKQVATTCTEEACVPTFLVSVVGSSDKVPVADVAVKLFNTPCSRKMRPTRPQCVKDDYKLTEVKTDSDGKVTLPRFYKGNFLTITKPDWFAASRDFDPFVDGDMFLSTSPEFGMVEQAATVAVGPGTLMEQNSQVTFQATGGNETSVFCKPCAEALQSYRQVEDDIATKKDMLEGAETLAVMEPGQLQARKKELAQRGAQLKNDLQKKKGAWLAQQASCVSALQSAESDIAKYKQVCRQMRRNEACDGGETGETGETEHVGPMSHEWTKLLLLAILLAFVCACLWRCFCGKP